MSQLVALSLSIALLGGVATFLLRAIGLAVWAAFIAWACFFHSGGDGKALKQTIIGNAFGCCIAYVALWLVVASPLGGSEAGIAVIVAITVLVLCLAAHVPALSSIPASVYGYASTVAFFLLTAQAKAIAMLTDIDYHTNPLLLIVLSMVAGALFGFASAKLAGALAKKA
ncbi:MAG TPA: DUF1097 domain-containing protein [Nitrospiraceae bacterium]|nr:DUF1097 domain-containing protein [Nitrospiraceae bacterium]